MLYRAAKEASNAVMQISADEPNQAEKFRLERIARVRLQLVRLDKMLAEENDPARLDRLMSALNRLQEAEGWLSGRAKPGNLKPSSKPSKRESFTPPAPADDPAA